AEGLHGDECGQQRDREQVGDARGALLLENRGGDEVAGDLEREARDGGDEHDLPQGHGVASALRNQLKASTVRATTEATRTGSPGMSTGVSARATTAAPAATAMVWSCLSRGQSSPRNAAAAAASRPHR